MFDDIHTVQTEGIANVGNDVNLDKCIFLDTKLYQHMVIKAATKRKLTNHGVYIILYICLVIKLKDECNKYVNEMYKRIRCKIRKFLNRYFVEFPCRQGDTQYLCHNTKP